MGLPSEPVTLSVEQVAELNRQLRDMRHDINNNLCYIVAALEIMRRSEKPDELRATLTQQAMRIPEQLKAFSATFEKALSISKP